MRADAFSRAVIESLVSRSIRKIAEDPERGLRNLVDMGVDTATGRFQKHYMKIVQGVLQDENCPYYELVCRLTRETSNRNLTTFGVNVGWQSWTVGARQIRAYEARHGVDVPWSLTLHMEGGAEGVDWAGLVRAGQEMGVCTYFLHVGEDRAAMEQAAALAESAPLCAFLLFAGPGAVRQAIGQLSGLDNVMTVLDAAGGGWREAAWQLREERRLYGFWRRCETDESAGEAESWLDELQHEGGPVVFLITGPACTEAGRGQILNLTRSAWERQRYPLLVFDYYDDILLVDGIISQGPCFAAVLPDGQPAIYRDGRERTADGESEQPVFMRELLHTI